MNREIISQALGNIDARYIQEAAEGASGKGGIRRFIGASMAAGIVLLLVVSGITLFRSSREGTVTVYARETGEEITAAGAVLHTGTISDSGEMKGHPLMFYLSGKDIASVRFSSKREQIYFMDWTEQREEYGSAQNFTVPYGEDESEYYYLTIDWVPNNLIRELTDNADSTIAGLPEEMRSDIIVMEITFENGRTVTKAITVSLLENGTFLAALEDYRISEADAFVRRPDSQAIPRDILYAQGDNAAKEAGDGETVWNGEDAAGFVDADSRLAAEAAVKDYYLDTVFGVRSMKVKEQTAEKIVFSVCVSKGGVVQEPDRTITLLLKDGEWKVVNEGY